MHLVMSIGRDRGRVVGLGEGLRGWDLVAGDLQSHLGNQPGDGSKDRQPRRTQREDATSHGAGGERHGQENMAIVALDHELANISLG